jgi:hypothetical protein
MNEIEGGRDTEKARNLDIPSLLMHRNTLAGVSVGSGQIATNTGLHLLNLEIVEQLPVNVKLT